MTIDCAVQHGVLPDDLEKGSAIHFSMVEDPEGNWLIVEIHVMSAATDGGDRSDD